MSLPLFQLIDYWLVFFLANSQHYTFNSQGQVVYDPGEPMCALKKCGIIKIQEHSNAFLVQKD